MRKQTNIEKIKALRASDYAQIGEAITYLLLSAFLIHLVPFRRWYCWIGEQSSTEVNLPLSSEQETKIYKLKHNVRRANKIMGNTSKCFAMSLTMKKMLSRRNLPVMLYLGVQKDGEKNLKAHAWVKSGKHIIYGGRNAGEKFKQLISFA